MLTKNSCWPWHIHIYNYIHNVIVNSWFLNFHGSVVCLNVGSWPIRRMMLTNPRKVFEYIDYTLEKVDVTIRSSMNISAFAIANLYGYNLREHGCLACKFLFKYLVRIAKIRCPTFVNCIYTAYSILQVFQGFWIL